MEALRAASESGGGDDDLVTESELLAMAGEMGVDSEQLRAVLARRQPDLVKQRADLRRSLGRS